MSAIKRFVSAGLAVAVALGVFAAVPYKSIAASDVVINEKNFPDKNFRNYVKEMDPNHNGKLTSEEISHLFTIDVMDKSVKSLKGIEYFKVLTSLYCANNQLTEIDVSKNLNLERIECSCNNLTKLDVSNNKNLRSLRCFENKISDLDVSKNTKLVGLECSGNGLKSLDIRKNTALEWLDCCDNKLASLDITANSKLEICEWGGQADNFCLLMKAGQTIIMDGEGNLSNDVISLKQSDWKDGDGNSFEKLYLTAKQAGTATLFDSTVKVLYKDVTNPKNFWYEPTYYLMEKDVVKGYNKQTKFKPDNDCTRAQMVTFLWRLNGQPKPSSTTTEFTDIKKGDYYYKAVLWAVEQGITTGVSKITFNPEGVCTRAQTVTFLWRMAGKPSVGSAKNPFKDVKKGDYFYDAVIWASKKKLVAGYSDGTFKPQGKCLRRQMVTFLYKYDKFINLK